MKRKISATLGFSGGFPETNTELNAYSAQIAGFHAMGTGIRLTQIRQIRNHNLNDLLIFSGAEGRIISSCYSQWLLVKNWNPEMRYVRQRLMKNKAAAFITAAKTILKEIS